ncbi:hypothetical protein [Arthrobacter sp. SDTb3-6]|uniref:hypothetical protein n=1 Tax=Arthrobacter sp. SDTb3-6 TaxID=2713571 RepID=UPI00159EAD27|nr:hypothetical protein [Arthrobacter sp. SDTb3-6]NVM97817.1 hypothetical protein [Arthrobacter sp. SDTb3-6]
MELDDLLKDVPVLVQFLPGAIHQTSVTRSPGASGGGGGHASSKPPINLDALLLRTWLCQLPDRAYGVAMEDPEAGQTLFMARLWVGQARDLVWGPEDKRVYGHCGEQLEDDAGPTLCDGHLVARPDDVSVKCQACGTVHHVHDILYRLRLKARGQPMPPRHVREYLQKKAKAFILKKDFENWVQMGRLAYVLDRVTTEGQAQRIYFPGDVLEVFQDMRGRRRIPT